MEEKIYEVLRLIDREVDKLEKEVERLEKIAKMLEEAVEAVQ